MFRFFPCIEWNEQVCFRALLVSVPFCHRRQLKYKMAMKFTALL